MEQVLPMRLCNQPRLTHTLSSAFHRDRTGRCLSLCKSSLLAHYSCPECSDIRENCFILATVWFSGLDVWIRVFMSTLLSPELHLGLSALISLVPQFAVSGKPVWLVSESRNLHLFIAQLIPHQREECKIRGHHVCLIPWCTDGWFVIARCSHPFHL